MYFAGVILISYEAEANADLTERIVAAGIVRCGTFGGRASYAILHDHGVWYVHDQLEQFEGSYVVVMFLPHLGRIDVLTCDGMRLGTLEVGPGEA